MTTKFTTWGEKHYLTQNNSQSKRPELKIQISQELKGYLYDQGNFFKQKSKITQSQILNSSIHWTILLNKGQCNKKWSTLKTLILSRSDIKMIKFSKFPQVIINTIPRPRPLISLRCTSNNSFDYAKKETKFVFSLTLSWCIFSQNSTWNISVSLLLSRLTEDPPSRINWNS